MSEFVLWKPGLHMSGIKLNTYELKYLERPRVLEVTTGALTDMKKLSNLLKLDRHWKQEWFSYEEIIQDMENML